MNAYTRTQPREYADAELEALLDSYRTDAGDLDIGAIIADANGDRLMPWHANAMILAAQTHNHVVQDERPEVAPRYDTGWLRRVVTALAMVVAGAVSAAVR